MIGGDGTIWWVVEDISVCSTLYVLGIDWLLCVFYGSRPQFHVELVRLSIS